MVLAEMKLDSTAIAAGLLHDAVEDTPVTLKTLRREFGEQVAHIVEGVTKIDKIELANREERQAENVRKMLLAMVDDVRVVLIKLADRLHNMRTLQHLPEERQQQIAKETLEIYAPLAHRLGHGQGARRAGRPGVPLRRPDRRMSRCGRRWSSGARRAKRSWRRSCKIAARRN